MAIARDSTLGATTKVPSAGSSTQSFTNTAGKVVIVGITRRDSGDDVTGVTYAGAAMTQIVKRASTFVGNNYCEYIYAKDSAATGANNIVISTSGAANDMVISAASYTGMQLPVDNTSSGESIPGTSPVSLSVTPSAVGCWVLMHCGNIDGNLTASTGSTLIGANASPNQMYDSNGSVTAGAGYNMQATFTGVRGWSGVIASFPPVPAPAGGGTLLMMGVG